MKKIYYAQQTEAALQNFPFSTSSARQELIVAIAMIKEASAKAHLLMGELTPTIARAIVKASKEVQNGKFTDQFVLPFLQGGAGTSIHMNVNEVIATRATEVLKQKHVVHPNDHVNKSQSTNDVGPSALKIACIPLLDALCQTLDLLAQSFLTKAKGYRHVKKLGRTHLQDAVPTSIEETFTSYAAVIQRGKMRLLQQRSYLYELNLGGTAVGNSVNASKGYRTAMYTSLRRITKLPVKPAVNLMSQTSSQTDFVALSQSLVAVMVDCSKIANDLRLLASGPNGGIGEIRLQSLQNGSSIMPGKVNPILPESVNQAYFFISGNNLTIEHAAQAAQLELGVMFPVLADRLVTSLRISQEVLQSFTTNCVQTLLVNEERCREHLEQSTAYATLLTPKLGYDAVSKMVKESYTRKNRHSFQQVLLQEEQF